MTDHSRFMRRALDLGRRGLGRTAPNPAVGCVLVRDGEVVGEGWHRCAGEPHAEVNALADAGDHARGAIAYVTLEPCDHTGRTGPCSTALLDAGVRCVVLGAIDPTAQAGGGAARLERAGVEVIRDIESEACEALLEPFATRCRLGRPLVTLKVATSLDGRIATSTGHSRWVTGEQSRLDVHRRRDQTDAILVGAGTVRADDPALTTRLPDRDDPHSPLRVVISGSLDLGDARLLTDGEADTLVITDAESMAATELRARGVEVLAVGGDAGAVDLGAALLALGGGGVGSLLVEGGQSIATSLLRARLVDRLVCYVAPKVIGGDGRGWAGPLGIRTMDRSVGLEGVAIRSLGDDVCIEGRCVYRNR